jgi:hypothetical protein
MSDYMQSPGKESESRHRRLSGKHSSDRRHERRRSHTIGHKMDTTMMSEMDYLNFLPDIEKLDMDDSSFLKGSFMEKTGGIRTKVESLETSKIDDIKVNVGYIN